MKENAGAMIRQITVKNLVRTASVAGGGRDEERRSKEHAGATIRETNVKTLPQVTIVAGGQDGENQHETERWHDPQTREGGKCPAGNKITCITEKIIPKHGPAPQYEKPDYPGRPPACLLYTSPSPRD